MEILRDGCGARAAFHHLSINPSVDYSEDQLKKAAKALRDELDPEGTRPYIVIAHHKRRENATEGGMHAHLLLGHSDGRKALKDGRSKIRTEVVARTLERENGEFPVRSRHANKVDRILRQRGLSDVADWIKVAYGSQSDAPRSAYGSKSRQSAKRAGLNLPAMKGAVARAFAVAGDLDELKTGLAAIGLHVEKGTKKNVWVVIDAAGNSVGALDRLLKLKRHVTCAMMEGQDGGIQNAKRSAADDRTARKAIVRTNQASARADRAAQDGARNTVRDPNWRGPDRGNHGVVEEPRCSSRASDVRNAHDQRQTGHTPRGAVYRRALMMLRRVGRNVESQLPADLPPQLPRHPGLTDIWGLPIEPPRYRP
jgi:hypothetical protein